MSFAHGLRPQFRFPNGLYSCAVDKVMIKESYYYRTTNYYNMFSDVTWDFYDVNIEKFNINVANSAFQLAGACVENRTLIYPCVFRLHRMHEMQPILLPMRCLPVSLSHGSSRLHCAKRLNRSKCCLE